MIVSTRMTFSSATSTEYLVYTVEGTMPHKGLILADARLLSARFYVLAITASLVLTPGPSGVLSGVGFGLMAKRMVSPCDTVEEILLSYNAYQYEYK
ncbi:hypothetical protein Tco_1396694 [Tanacetum coccineum]